MYFSSTLFTTLVYFGLALGNLVGKKGLGQVCAEELK